MKLKKVKYFILALFLMFYSFEGLALIVIKKSSRGIASIGKVDEKFSSAQKNFSDIINCSKFNINDEDESEKKAFNDCVDSNISKNISRNELSLIKSWLQKDLEISEPSYCDTNSSVKIRNLNKQNDIFLCFESFGPTGTKYVVYFKKENGNLKLAEIKNF